jgi:hypothetical protein
MIKREERFIIFNGEMVRSILEGRKTQTRRPIKGKVLLNFIDFMTGHADEVPGNTEDLGQIWEGNKIRLYSAEYPEEGSELFECPYGCPRNILQLCEDTGGDAAKPVGIFCEITDIRVERVQEISEGDCEKEGIKGIPCKCGCGCDPEYVYQFKNLWNSIYANPFPWSANPWVWVITFKVVKQ